MNQVYVLPLFSDLNLCDYTFSLVCCRLSQVATHTYNSRIDRFARSQLISCSFTSRFSLSLLCSLPLAIQSTVTHLVAHRSQLAFRLQQLQHCCPPATAGDHTLSFSSFFKYIYIGRLVCLACQPTLDEMDYTLLGTFFLAYCGPTHTSRDRSH